MAELIFSIIIETGKKIVKLLRTASSNKKDVQKIEALINLVNAVCSDMTSQENLVREKIEKDPRMTAAAEALKDALLEAEEIVKKYNLEQRTTWKKAAVKVLCADSIAETIRESTKKIYKLMLVSNYAMCNDTNSTVTETNIKVKEIYQKLEEKLLLGRRDMGTTSSSAVAERPRVWSEPDLRARQQEDTARVSTSLSLPFGVAALLLRHCNWTPDRVLNALTTSSSLVVKGISLIRDKLKCNICLDDARPDAARTMVSAGCSHYYCEDCWRGYIHAVVGTGRQCLSSLRCPDLLCRAAVPRELVQEVACHADVVLYDQFVYWSYVDDSGGRMKWCPGPDCSSAAECQTSTAIVVDCDDCKHRYCWGCGEEPHRPLSCDTACLWLDTITDRLDLELVFTKRCPKCRRTIDIYNQNTNIVTCSCCHRFCWVCLHPVGAWGINHTADTSCASYRSFAEIYLRLSVGKDIEQLPKWLQDTHREMMKTRNDRKLLLMASEPYERWEADQASLRQALAQLDGHKNSGLGVMAAMLDVQDSQLNFVTQAYDEITVSWRAIRWVHAYEYSHLDRKRDQRKCQQLDYLHKEANDSIQRLQDVVALQNIVMLIQGGVEDDEAIFQIYNQVMGLIEDTRRKVDKLMESFDTDNIQH